MIHLEDPLIPDPETAQSLALEELARPEYNSEADPVSRFFSWLVRTLSNLIGQGDHEFPVDLAMLIGFVVLLIILGTLVIFNPIRLRNGRSSAVLGDENITLDEARARLAKAVSTQQWDEAVVWSVRCQALILDELKIIRVSPGLTAQEVARAASSKFPERTEQYAIAARTFDKVRYGDSAVAEADYRRVAELLDMLTSRRTA